MKSQRERSHYKLLYTLQRGSDRKVKKHAGELYEKQHVLLAVSLHRFSALFFSLLSFGVGRLELMLPLFCNQVDAIQNFSNENNFFFSAYPLPILKHCFILLCESRRGNPCSQWGGLINTFQYFITTRHARKMNKDREDKDENFFCVI